MRNRTTFTLMAGALAAMATAVGCGDTALPTSPGPRTPSYHEIPPPPNDQANFRLTGGGRVDGHRHEDGAVKSTPESHDFATFGFQARPVGPGTTEGSGNITWVEHYPDDPSIGGGFTFHGRVTWFRATTTPGCGTFGGMGSARRRDGMTFPDIEFTVEHACDVREPGVGADHIMIMLPGYSRHAILSGGNIQAHKL